MTWILINTSLSLLGVLLLVYKLIYLSSDNTRLERFGIAWIASALTLNIGPIVANNGFPYGDNPTPFDDWGSTMLRLGIIIYFLSRVFQHWLKNREQMHQAKRDMVARYKAKVKNNARSSN